MPPVRREITVAVSKYLLDGFRRRAKRLYPREAYGILLGAVSKSLHIIDDICYPNGWDAGNDSGVRVTEGMWQEAEVDARFQGLSILGDIHSHPYDDPECLKHCAPSQADLDRFQEDYLQGIMVIVKHGGKMRSRCRFWLAGPQTTTVLLH